MTARDFARGNKEERDEQQRKITVMAGTVDA